jgi:multidrug resistance protein, MATE family
MYIQSATTALHPVWCYLFVHVFDMGIIGPALAQSISTMLNIVVLSFLLHRKPEFKDMFFWPNRECLKGMGNYIKTGVLGMWIIWLEWCAFEFLTFMSGYLDVDQTGA